MAGCIYQVMGGGVFYDLSGPLFYVYINSSVKVYSQVYSINMLMVVIVPRR